MEGLAYKWIKKDQPKLILSENYKRALSSAPSSSNPGLPRRANMFFLYASTPGWSNGVDSIQVT